MVKLDATINSLLPPSMDPARLPPSSPSSSSSSSRPQQPASAPRLQERSQIHDGKSPALTGYVRRGGKRRADLEPGDSGSPSLFVAKRHAPELAPGIRDKLPPEILRVIGEFGASTLEEFLLYPKLLGGAKDCKSGPGPALPPGDGEYATARRTAEVLRKAVQAADPDALASAVRSNPDWIFQLAIYDDLPRNVYEAAVSVRPQCLRIVPEKYMDDDMLVIAVKAMPQMIARIPMHKRSSAVCLAAVTGNGLMLRHVPQALWESAPQIVSAAMKQNPDAVAHAELVALQRAELLARARADRDAGEYDGDEVGKLPEEQRSHEVYMELLPMDLVVLEHMARDFCDINVFRLAATRYKGGWGPYELLLLKEFDTAFIHREPETAKDAVLRNGLNLFEVPAALKGKDWCLSAVNSEFWDAYEGDERVPMEAIPRDVFDPAIGLAVVQKCPQWLPKLPPQSVNNHVRGIALSRLPDEEQPSKEFFAAILVPLLSSIRGKRDKPGDSGDL